MRRAPIRLCHQHLLEPHKPRCAQLALPRLPASQLKELSAVGADLVVDACLQEEDVVGEFFVGLEEGLVPDRPVIVFVEISEEVDHP